MASIVGARVGARPCRVSRLAYGPHKKVVPSDVRAELAALHRTRDNHTNFGYLAFDWTVVGAAVLLARVAGMDPVAYALAVVVIASRQRALRSLVHDASHAKLFENQVLNRWCGRLFAAFPLGTGLSSYTCSHCRHHRELWAETDPKAQAYAALGLLRPVTRAGAFVRRHVLAPLLLLHAPVAIASSVSWRDEERTETLWRACYWTVVVCACAAAGALDVLALFWLVPYCTVYQLLRYWSDMADHAGLQSDDPWKASRSWDAAAPVRWLLSPHDDRYHLAHHMYPGIPHYEIEAAHRALLRVPEYAAGHHCDGFFLARSAGRPSVLQDVRAGNRPSHDDTRAGAFECPAEASCPLVSHGA